MHQSLENEFFFDFIKFLTKQMFGELKFKRKKQGFLKIFNTLIL